MGEIILHWLAGLGVSALVLALFFLLILSFVTEVGKAMWAAVLLLVIGGPVIVELAWMLTVGLTKIGGAVMNIGARH